jgi:glyoxylase-like metal-dependent hydrolase (beta-lactamase superfamily II)
MTTTPYDLRHVANQGWDQRIRVFQYERLVTTFAVISMRYVVLLDTLLNRTMAGMMLDAVRDELRAGRQLLVINTHADWDHAWGNAAFVGPDALHVAPVIGHRLCRERLLSSEAQAELAQKQTAEPQLFADVRLMPPTITFAGSLTIDGGDLTIELIPTPGHTPDHLSIWIPEIQTLFTGDAAEIPFPSVGSPDDLPYLRASLKQLQALDPTTTFYCHAPGYFHPAGVQANIAYFDEVEQRVVTALTADRIPAVIDETTDVEALIDYPFDDVPDTAGLDQQERALYRSGHHQAIRAMLAHLQARPTP